MMMNKGPLVGMDIESILKNQNEKAIRKILEKLISENYLQKDYLDELNRLK